MFQSLLLKQYKGLKRFKLQPCLVAQKQGEGGGGGGRGEGSASLKNALFVFASCTTLHKQCAAKLCLPTVAHFKRVQPHLRCSVDGESRAIAALRGGNETQAHFKWGAASQAAHHAHHLLCMGQGAPWDSLILLLE